MKQKILKLTKILNRFTIDDILSMEESCKEDELKNILLELEKEKNISKISETEYAYIESITMQTESKIQKERPNITTNIDSIDLKNIKIEELFRNTEDYEFYKKSKSYDQRNMVKILTLFKIAKGLKGEALRNFLNVIGLQYPDYKISLSSFKRYEKNYRENGIKCFCLNYHNFGRGGKSPVTAEMYALFKKYYFSPQKYTMTNSWKMVCDHFHDMYIPCEQSFFRMLMKEFRPEEIKMMRKSTPISMPDLSNFDNDKKEIRNIEPNAKIYDYFIDATKDYVKNLGKTPTGKSQRSTLTNHLIPYFKNYKFQDITQDVLVKYQSKKIAEGYSLPAVRRHIALLSLLFSRYSDCRENVLYLRDTTLIPPLEIDYYSDGEIQEIIKRDKPAFWIICLGITPSELAVLRYEDIDMKERTVSIKRASFNGLERGHWAKYRLRTLFIPPKLFNEIDPNKTNGLIFEKIEINNYDKLLNTHIHLLLKKNVQMNIISKNLGYQTIKDFELRYNFLLPQQLDKNFEII